ncbi:MAG: hypothetical protein RR497_07220, partial [Oscillospiraceae bacterium]
MKKCGFDIKTVFIVVIVLLLLFIFSMSCIIIVVSGESAMSSKEFVLLEGVKKEYGMDVTFLNKKYSVDLSFFDNIKTFINKHPAVFPPKGLPLLFCYSA